MPGVTFGATFPRLAELADKLAVVRSYVPGDANHDIKPVVGRDTFGANLGSLYARVAGMNHPATGMPDQRAPLPAGRRSRDAAGQCKDFGNFPATGPLGHALMRRSCPAAAATCRRTCGSTIARDRLDDRRALLARLDGLRRAARSHRRHARPWTATRDQAFDVMLGGVADAFDLSKEDPKLVARYDTAPLVTAREDRREVEQLQELRRQRQVAGQAAAAGPAAVRGAAAASSPSTTNFVWDMHADVNNAPLRRGHALHGRAARSRRVGVLEDVEQRGLSDKILLVCCGEMGRTPRINKNGGRDHWGNLGPLLLSGGGLNMGQVIGQSAATAASRRPSRSRSGT